MLRLPSASIINCALLLSDSAHVATTVFAGGVELALAVMVTFAIGLSYP